MEMSDNIADLAAALSKAQAGIEGASKGSENPAFKQAGKAIKYADLAAIWDACRDALTANGLSVVQLPGLCIDNRMSMTTMLLHSSGQWLRETLSIPLGKVDAQGYGSATTYARRYSLAAMVGIVQEDDDGNAASKPSGASNDGGIAISEDQLRELLDLRERSGADLKVLCDYYKIDALPSLPANRFDHCKRELEKQLAKKFPQKEAA